MQIPPLRFHRAAVALAALAGVAAWAQNASTPDLGRVEITGDRQNELQQRRESTASKIVIGREELERQGDSTIGEVLKRLPGISIDGPPGRFGAVRMRGLSRGYTQILLDGQRLPPGFSIESLTPEMVERIEILRAPTAETGAQAIAGTINIILREGQRGMPTDVKATLSAQGGYYAPQATMTRNAVGEDWSANYTLAFNSWAGPDQSETETRRETLDAQGQPLPMATVLRQRQIDSHYRREGMSANARLQKRLGPGESLTLSPFFAFSRGVTQGDVNLLQIQPLTAQSTATTHNDNHFGVGRVLGQWRQRLGADSNLEHKFNIGGWDSQTVFDQIPLTGNLITGYRDITNTHDRSVTLSSKYTRILGGGHQWISGIEVEAVQRSQSVRSSLSLLNASGDFNARTERWALYTQDEWQVNPKWALHGGVRHESLVTQGNNGAGEQRNQNAVFTPLLHALYKPNPERNDQLRLSLSKSFRTPTMPNLMARRTYSRDINSPTNPDSMGNPDLRPEVALGLDLAVERYLAEGGVLSASVFHRRVQNLIRSVTSLETTGDQRWVSMPRNIGEAITEGLELEAKFRLNQWVEGAPAVDLRSNASFFRSRVLSVPGPNNRLDQQPRMTLNLGGDYRLRSAPFTLGGNLNYNPGYTTRTSDVQTLFTSQKRVVDAYVVWRVDPRTAWRLSLNNLDPRLFTTGNTFNNGSLVESSETRNRSWLNAQIRLEKKI